MADQNQVDLNQYVKKQTFFTVVILSLMIGFIGGTIYSSFKLSDGQTANVGGAPSGPAPSGAAAPEDHTAQFAAEIMRIEQMLEKNPENAELWATLGNLFFDTSQVKNAIQAYEKSLELEPGKLGVMTDLGVMYRRNDQPERAVDMFDKVIEMNPKFEQARFNKGIVLLHDLNDFDAGIQAWEELVKVNPSAITSTGETLKEVIKRMKESR